MRFHVVGMGPIGSLVAHHLRIVLPHSHQISLIHRTQRLTEDARKDTIRIEHNGVITSSTGYESEVFKKIEEPKLEVRGTRRRSTIFTKETPVEHLQTIESLIITTKAHRTIHAVKLLLPRLSTDCTIVLLHNGLGVYEQLIQEVFRNPETRPHFILASNTHGAWQRHFTKVVHTVIGEIEFGIVPDAGGRDFEVSLKDERIPKHDRHLRIDDIGTVDDPYFLRYRSLRLTVAALSAMEALDAKWKPIGDVHVAMRRKLVVNAVISPLTALIGCRNGDLFKHNETLRIARKVCYEASTAYTNEMKSSAQSMLESIGDDDNERQMPLGRLPRALEPHALESECLRVAEITKGNISPMLADVRLGKPTEIDYINGYLLQLGKAYRADMPTNSLLLELVKLRTAIPLDQTL
jgi:2-dehydropantoate 2-reductase